MARGKASSSSGGSRPTSQPRASPPPAQVQHQSQPPVQYQSGGGMGLGGALMQGAAIGAGAEAGRMAIGSMFGGSGGGHQQQPAYDQGYQQQNYQGYQEPQGTNWLLWGGIAAAAAGGAYVLSRNMSSSRALLPLLGAPMASPPQHKFKKPEDY